MATPERTRINDGFPLICARQITKISTIYFAFIWRQFVTKLSQVVFSTLIEACSRLIMLVLLMASAQFQRKYFSVQFNEFRIIPTNRPHTISSESSFELL